MSAKRNQLAYLEVAVRNANPIEQVIVLYDILTGDLLSAIEAIKAGDVELRSSKLKHGFLALQQLEGSLNLDEGGELVTNMSRFYYMLRGEMMKAQIQQDARVLDELIQLLFSVREAWVELNGRLTGSTQAAADQTALQVFNSRVSNPVIGSDEIKTASWKA
jgi:flagellar secretion chaperone FliS